MLVRRKPLGAAGAVVLCALITVALLAPVLAPYNPYKFNLNERGLPIRMQPPGGQFFFGSDDVELSRLCSLRKQRGDGSVLG
jgi:peptide/nickel transport system permease protein